MPSDRKCTDLKENVNQFISYIFISQDTCDDIKCMAQTKEECCPAKVESEERRQAVNLFGGEQ